MTGDRWLAVARNWLDPTTVAHTIEPLVADWRHEVALRDTALVPFAPWGPHLALLAISRVLSSRPRDGKLAYAR